MAVFKKLNIEWLRHPGRYRLKRTESKDLNRHLHTNVCSSITCHKTQKHLKDPRTGESVNKPMYPTVTHDSVKHELLTGATAWTSLENAMLSEINQT